jgi:hypothetical protein
MCSRCPARWKGDISLLSNISSGAGYSLGLDGGSIEANANSGIYLASTASSLSV